MKYFSPHFFLIYIYIYNQQDKNIGWDWTTSMS